MDAFGSPAYNFASVSLFQWVLMGLGMSAAGLGARTSAAEQPSRAAESTRGVSAPLWRGLQYGAAGLAALAVASQIVPTLGVALAQTCEVGTSGPGARAFQTRVTGSRTLRFSGDSATILATINGKPARGTVFTYMGTGLSLVTITESPAAARTTLTRNSTQGTGQITGRAQYTDPSTGTRFVLFEVIQVAALP